MYVHQLSFYSNLTVSFRSTAKPNPTRLGASGSIDFIPESFHLGKVTTDRPMSSPELPAISSDVAQIQIDVSGRSSTGLTQHAKGAV